MEATSTLTNFRILLWIILIVITIIIVIIIIIIVPPSSSWRSPKIHARHSVRSSKTALRDQKCQKQLPVEGIRPPSALLDNPSALLLKQKAIF